jgi:hypothetical protein
MNMSDAKDKRTHEKPVRAANMNHSQASHFDRRGATYDREEIHHHVVSLLVAGEIRSGFRVLDKRDGQMAWANWCDGELKPFIASSSQSVTFFLCSA